MAARATRLLIDKRGSDGRRAAGGDRCNESVEVKRKRSRARALARRALEAIVQKKEGLVNGKKTDAAAPNWVNVRFR